MVSVSLALSWWAGRLPAGRQGRGASYHLGHPHARSPTVSLFFGKAAVSRGRMIPLEQQKSKADLTPPLVYLPWGRPRIFPCRRFPIRGISRGWATLISILSIRWHPCRSYNIQDARRERGGTVFHLPPALAACPEATLRKPMLTAAAIMDIIP